jgi:EAL domain-containing protein (putative c-di-GMP-specific phosphodiesterase class I)/ActR/RegA family two-component response regulator
MHHHLGTVIQGWVFRMNGHNTPGDHDDFAATETPAACGAPICFIVEDEPGIRQVITYSLHDYGIATKEFDNAPAVLNALEHISPSLCFLDVSLEGSDAIDVIRGLAQHNYRGPVQLMSGKDPALLEEIRRVGERHSLCMLSVLSKPFRAEAVRKIVREHCGEQLMQATRASSGTTSSVVPMPGPGFDLDQMLREKWLQLWYQPKIDMRQRSLAGAEGLVRGIHPEHGIVPPGAFLPNAAEDSMLRLTETVLLTAMRDWEDFSKHGFTLRMALNVPVSALVKLPIAMLVRENRPKSEKWPGLILEVTEDQIVRDIPLAHEIATQLKIYNIVLAIDDFGTGYSHLARLRELPFAELKLDRNLVMNCGEDETNAALCQTGIDLAHRFGSKAVAEGIEKNTELEALLKMGCDLGQGFLFAPPMAKDRFISLLKQRAQRRLQGNVA